MKTALLHIGTMKTGNTSIHHSLVRAKACGVLGKICYPLWKEDLHQARMAALYCPDRLEELLPSLRERYPAERQRFERMLQAYRAFAFRELRYASGAIISAETFSHVFTASMATSLRRDLEEAGFQQFRVVLYVRDPADYYLSNMSQNLRMSEALPLIKDPATFQYNFLQIAETWEEAFPGQVSVRRYPPDGAQDAVADFNTVVEDCFGVAIPSYPIRKNVTLSAEGMHVLQDYRTRWGERGTGRITPDAAKLVRALIDSMSIVPQTKPALKPEFEQQIRDNHAVEAEELCRRYGVSVCRGGGVPVHVAPRAEPYRVAEIVRSLDPEIIPTLLLWVVREELQRVPSQRSLAYRAAAMMYRHLPEALRSARLHRLVKKLV